tara:strand:- start:416 stop:529 length:114 start_codon:yes stop_codon:yes gene_type:complete
LRNTSDKKTDEIKVQDNDSYEEGFAQYDGQRDTLDDV